MVWCLPELQSGGTNDAQCLCSYGHHSGKLGTWLSSWLECSSAFSFSTRWRCWDLSRTRALAASVRWSGSGGFLSVGIWGFFMPCGLLFLFEFSRGETL